jgi:hypothetical protein
VKSRLAQGQHADLSQVFPEIQPDEIFPAGAHWQQRLEILPLQQQDGAPLSNSYNFQARPVTQVEGMSGKRRRNRDSVRGPVRIQVAVGAGAVEGSRPQRLLGWKAVQGARQVYHAVVSVGSNDQPTQLAVVERQAPAQYSPNLMIAY